MRKKSHFSLASYILGSEGMELLHAHKKALYWGSIQPDCIPSFLTRKHCIEDTFPILKKELSLLINEYDHSRGVTSYFCKHLGIILHYIADYFTFPHNSFYPGNFKDHCFYENEMKFYLRSYVRSENAKRKRMKKRSAFSVEDLCRLIEDTHKAYQHSDKSVANDCSFIVSICHKIADFLLSLLEREHTLNYATV